jgi:hypothetical protein
MDLIQNAKIQIDRKGISHFRMRRTHSVHLVQHSKYFLKAWKANCDVKLLLYFSDPTCPDLCEIEDVCRYVVAYWQKTQYISRRERSDSKYHHRVSILMEIFWNWKNFQIPFD